jgi:two-component system chemotaxis response regulator CheB
MPELIARRGELPAEHARDGAAFEPGHVYVAPPDYHLVLEEKAMRLSHGPKENGHRPAIDPLFRSAAELFGERVAGVLLTGNLDDGADGLVQIHRHGGMAIVQDPTEAIYPDMPLSALRSLRPDYCLGLKEIQQLLEKMPNRSRGRRNMKARTVRKRSRELGEPPRDGAPVGLSCPECHGPLWKFKDDKLLRFQCLVGHRYSLASLVAGKSEELESALWIALRILEERISLQKRLALESEQAGHSASNRMFKGRAAETQKSARLIRSILEKIQR